MKGIFLFLILFSTLIAKQSIFLEFGYNNLRMEDLNDFLEKQVNSAKNTFSSIGIEPNTTLVKVEKASSFEVGFIFDYTKDLKFLISCEYLEVNDFGWKINSSGVWFLAPYEIDIRLDLRSFVTAPYLGVIYELTKDKIRLSPCIFVGYAFGELKGDFKNYTKLGNQTTDYKKDIEASGENLTLKLKVLLDFSFSKTTSLNLSFGYRVKNIPEFKYKKDVDINNDGTITKEQDLIKGEPIEDKETSDVVKFDYSGIFLSLGITYRF